MNESFDGKPGDGMKIPVPFVERHFWSLNRGPDWVKRKRPELWDKWLAMGRIFICERSDLQRWANFEIEAIDAMAQARPAGIFFVLIGRDSTLDNNVKRIAHHSPNIEVVPLLLYAWRSLRGQYD